MIPIRDTIRSRNYPAVNTLIIAANVLLYLIEMAQGQDLERFIFYYGLVPARYSIPVIASHFTYSEQGLALFSFMFLHGSFWHLLGNMWSLYIFGDNVEDRMGPIRYLLFCLCCGWVSGLAQMVTHWYSQTPTIGASGAIAGVMGAYLVLYPRAKILTLIPIFFIPFFVDVPASFFLGIWFLFQFVSAMGSPGAAGGIAFWAHVGGFVFGMALLKLFALMPELGFTSQVRQTTTREKTPLLHLLRSATADGSANLYGQISITPFEARAGTRKMFSVPSGLRSKLIRVRVPPGVSHGTILRLQQAGQAREDGGKGDLFLKVLVQE
jgi:membrane associated rhomboid family serine protease